MKKLLTGVVIVLITAGMLNACSEMEDESPSSSSSEYTAPEYKEMPDLRHMSLEKAIATLHGEGWTDVEAVEENDGTESTVRLDQTGYHIASQNPHNGKTGVSTDTHVRLTVHKDRTRTISNLVAVNDPWDEAFEKTAVGRIGKRLRLHLRRWRNGRLFPVLREKRLGRRCR